MGYFKNSDLLFQHIISPIISEGRKEKRLMSTQEVLRELTIDTEQVSKKEFCYTMLKLGWLDASNHCSIFEKLSMNRSKPKPSVLLCWLPSPNMITMAIQTYYYSIICLFSLRCHLLVRNGNLALRL